MHDVKIEIDQLLNRELELASSLDRVTRMEQGESKLVNEAQKKLNEIKKLIQEEKRRVEYLQSTENDFRDNLTPRPDWVVILEEKLPDWAPEWPEDSVDQYEKQRKSWLTKENIDDSSSHLERRQSFKPIMPNDQSQGNEKEELGRNAVCDWFQKFVDPTEIARPTPIRAKHGVTRGLTFQLAHIAERIDIRQAMANELLLVKREISVKQQELLMMQMELANLASGRKINPNQNQMDKSGKKKPKLHRRLSITLQRLDKKFSSAMSVCKAVSVLASYQKTSSINDNKSEPIQKARQKIQQRAEQKVHSKKQVKNEGKSKIQALVSKDENTDDQVDYFKALGNLNSVPKYLRWNGKVRKRNLTKAQVEVNLEFTISNYF